MLRGGGGRDATWLINRVSAEARKPFTLAGTATVVSAPRKALRIEGISDTREPRRLARANGFEKRLTRPSSNCACYCAVSFPSTAATDAIFERLQSWCVSRNRLIKKLPLKSKRYVWSHGDKICRYIALNRLEQEMFSAQLIWGSVVMLCFFGTSRYSWTSLLQKW